MPAVLLVPIVAHMDVRGVSHGRVYNTPMSETIGNARPAPGSKFTSPQGTRAVKDGIRPSKLSYMPDVARKPPWLRVKLPAGAKYEEIRDIVRTHKLSTVCAESKCQHRRMLGPRHRHIDADGFGVHARLQVLFGVDRQSARLAGSAGACQRRRRGRDD